MSILMPNGREVFSHRSTGSSAQTLALKSLSQGNYLVKASQGGTLPGSSLSVGN